MEGDEDELEDLDDCWKTYKVFHVASLHRHTLRMLTRCGVYSRAAFISLSASNCAAFIQGRRLLAEIRYVLKLTVLVKL